MKVKWVISILLSIILPLISILINNGGNKFGYPINFLFFKGGKYDYLEKWYEIIFWKNIKLSSFRVDLYLINVCVILLVFILCLKWIEKTKS